MHNIKRLPNFLLVLSKNISCDLSSNHGLAVRPLKLLLQQSRSYSVSRVWRCSYHYAAEQFSDDEYECDGDNNTVGDFVPYCAFLHIFVPYCSIPLFDMSIFIPSSIF